VGDIEGQNKHKKERPCYQA